MVVKSDHSLSLKNEVHDLVSSLGISKYRSQIFSAQSNSHTSTEENSSDQNKSKNASKKHRVKNNYTLNDGAAEEDVSSKQQKQKFGKQKPHNVDRQGKQQYHNREQKRHDMKQKNHQGMQQNHDREQKQPIVEKKQHIKWDDDFTPIQKSVKVKVKNGETARTGFPEDGAFESVRSDESVDNIDNSQEHQPWYQKLPDCTDAVAIQIPSEVSRLRHEASSIMECAAATFKKSGGGMQASQWRWMSMVLTSGTLSDKLAVRYSLLRRAPELNLSLLEDTIKLVAVKGKSHSIVAMARLSSMFTEFLLPSDRVLRPFNRQPFSSLQQLNAAQRQDRLVLWLLEDRLKLMYRQFVDRLREMSHDTVEKIRKHSVVTMATLLTSRPEQEQTLLENLVNKIGDERRTICCLTVRKLSKLLRVHPAMRTVVVKEVERLLFRPNVGKRVQFYGVCFLAQVQLSSEGDEDLALRLIRIYIGFFKASVKQAELDERLLRALLAGLTNCTRKCELATSELQQYTTPLYHIAQLSCNLSVVTQSLQLIFRLSSSQQAAGIPPDRFYTLLYKKVFVGGLSVSAKLSDFLNLLFCAISVDDCDRRVRAFIKRLLQWSLQQSAELVCAVLMMVAELLRVHPQLHAFLPPDGTSAPEGDSEQVWQEEDDEEHLQDIDTSDEESTPPTTTRPTTTSGWTFTNPLYPSSTGNSTPTSQYKLSSYSARHRDPRWCRAELQPLHELLLLQQHYHPTVALFATQLLQLPAPAASQPAPAGSGAERSSAVKYPGNPLVDFKLMRFLNRFCYRNPKRLAGAGSVDESGAGGNSDSGLSARGMAVTSVAYGRLPDAEVPQDERFFHWFFSRRRQCDDPDDRLTDASGNVTDAAFDQYMQQMVDDGSARNRRKQQMAEGDESGSDDEEETDFAAEMMKPTKRKHNKDELAEDDEGGDDDEDFDEDEDDGMDGFSSEEDDGTPVSFNKKRKCQLSQMELGDEFVPADQVNLDSDDDDEQVPMMDLDDDDDEDDGNTRLSGKAAKGKRRQAQWERSRSVKSGPRKRTAGNKRKRR